MELREIAFIINKAKKVKGKNRWCLITAVSARNIIYLEKKGYELSQGLHPGNYYVDFPVQTNRNKREKL